MSTHPFSFTAVTANNIRQNPLSHLSSRPAQRPLNRVNTLPTQLNTNLHDVELAPLPSPYSPVSGSDSSAYSLFNGNPNTNKSNNHSKASHLPLRLQQLGSALSSATPQNTPINDDSNNMRRWDLDLDLEMDDNKNTADLANGLNWTGNAPQPMRKKAKVVSSPSSNTLTRWDSMRSACSDDSMDSMDSHMSL